MPVPLAFLVDGFGGPEMLLILAVALVFFGPRRIPGIARSIGRAVSELRRASRDFQDQVMRIEEPPSQEGGSAVSALAAAAPGQSEAKDGKPPHAAHDTEPAERRPGDAGGSGPAG
jgi:TatA/E family protein of Tat protein translocase